ncbi:Protein STRICTOSIDINE SYNTHASE-LIKE 10 [Linum grandiflorum]
MKIMASAITLLVAFSAFASFVVMSQTISFRQLQFPRGKPGGFSVAFAPFGEFFTSFTDGLIFQYRPLAGGWRFFAFTAPTRARNICDNTSDPNLGPICGYPLGLAYDGLTGQVYVTDAYKGLLTVGPDPGTFATPLATSANGVPFNATNGIDFDPLRRNIYFTDSSTNYQIRNSRQAIDSNDTTGRLLLYNINTDQLTLLSTGLGFSTGVAMSSDGSYLLVSETSRDRVTRFWRTGPMANTSEPFIVNIIEPRNIRRTALGQFWIAARMVDQPSQTTLPIAIRVDGTGRIFETISLEEQYGNFTVLEVQQPSLNDLYVSSPSTPFLGIYERGLLL